MCVSTLSSFPILVSIIVNQLGSNYLQVIRRN